MSKKAEEVFQDFKDDLQKWSDYIDSMSYEDLMNRALELYEDFSKEAINETEDDIIDTVIQSLSGEVKSILAGNNVEEDRIFITAVESPSFWARNILKDCQEAWSKDKELAIEEGYVKADKNELGEYYNITYLDYRETKADGTENKNKGSPLDQAWMRTLHGLIIFTSDWEEDNVKLRPFTTTISGLYANPKSKKFKKVVVNEWIMTELRPRLDKNKNMIYDGDEIVMNVTKNTDFTNFIEEPIEYNYANIPSTFYPERLITLKNLEKTFDNLHKNHGWTSKSGWSKGVNYMTIAKVRIQDIAYSNGDYNDRVEVTSKERPIMDEDGNLVEDIVCWWDQSNVEIFFDRETVGYLFFKMKRSIEKDDDGNRTGVWGDINFVPMGFIPVKLVEKESNDVQQESKNVDGTVDLEGEELSEEDLGIE